MAVAHKGKEFLSEGFRSVAGRMAGGESSAGIRGCTKLRPLLAGWSDGGPVPLWECLTPIGGSNVTTGRQGVIGRAVLVDLGRSLPKSPGGGRQGSHLGSAAVQGFLG